MSAQPQVDLVTPLKKRRLARESTDTLRGSPVSTPSPGHQPEGYTSTPDYDDAGGGGALLGAPCSDTRRVSSQDSERSESLLVANGNETADDTADEGVTTDTENEATSSTMRGIDHESAAVAARPARTKNNGAQEEEEEEDAAALEQEEQGRDSQRWKTEPDKPRLPGGAAVATENLSAFVVQTKTEPPAGGAVAETEEGKYRSEGEISSSELEDEILPASRLHHQWAADEASGITEPTGADGHQGALLNARDEESRDDFDNGDSNMSAVEAVVAATDAGAPPSLPQEKPKPKKKMSLLEYRQRFKSVGGSESTGSTPTKLPVATATLFVTGANHDEPSSAPPLLERLSATEAFRENLALKAGKVETSRDAMFAGLSLEERLQSLQSLPAFQDLKEECNKTQREKERESLTARLRKEFGLSDDDDDAEKDEVNGDPDDSPPPPPPPVQGHYTMDLTAHKVLPGGGVAAAAAGQFPGLYQQLAGPMSNGHLPVVRPGVGHTQPRPSIIMHQQHGLPGGTAIRARFVQPLFNGPPAMAVAAAQQPLPLIDQRPQPLMKQPLLPAPSLHLQVSAPSLAGSGGGQHQPALPAQPQHAGGGRGGHHAAAAKHYPRHPRTKPAYNTGTDYYY
ncbi:PREDICTED: retinitis pigmentosa 1-like 1 protein [Priapulus caudatus]|uniref:Retinitis pigmentosa 1-like 1 protein n=1 Tax=Priapulus caudatus TaxID=37621 RepID=A0ABM1EBB8_PRICU|nr:PREDICTED: retinitis pigmentosa 1-like 1 protein [Priapulus caudatus]